MEGVPDVLPKSLGGQGIQEKFKGGVPPILGFITFLLTSVSKICLGGAILSPHLTSAPRVHPWTGFPIRKQI